MKEQKILVPKRRFKEFHNTYAWEQRKLLDTVIKVIDFRGRTPKKLGLGWSEDGYLALSALNVKNGYIDESVDAHYGDQELYDAWMRGNELHQGQVLFTTEAPMGNVAQVPDNRRYILSQRTIAFVVDERIITEDYLAVVLGSPKIFNRLTELSSGGTAKGVSQKSLSELTIPIPNATEEQNKIGSLFKQLDNLITLHQRKLEKTKALKTACLSEMFPTEGEREPKRRFVGFTGAWEQRRLGDVLSSMKSGLSRMLSNDDIGLPVIRANNINEGRLDLTNDIKYWYANDPQGADTSNYFIHKNDMLVNFINSEAKMGTAAIVDTEPLRDTIYTTNILNLRINNLADTYFIFLLTLTEKYKNYIKLITKPAVNQASFTTIDFKEFAFLAPTMQEQIKIGEFFKQLDNLITLHQRKLEKLESIKKAYLNEMFV
jgi:type I restriction enzyme S subunit